MLHRILLAIALLFAPLAAQAQEIEGTWDFRVADTTIFRYEIAENEDGSWQGTWYRPNSFVSDGNRFVRLRGGVEEVTSMAGYEFAGNVELSFEDPRPGAVPDIFRFELVGPDTVEMTYVGTDLEPYALVRAGEADPIGNWEEAAIYRRVLAEGDVDDEMRVRIPEARGEDDALRLDLTQVGGAVVEEDTIAPEPQIDTEEASESVGGEDSEDEEDRSRVGADFLDGL